MAHEVVERGQRLWPVDVPLGDGYEITPGRLGNTPGLEVVSLPDPEQLKFCRAKAGECKAYRVGDTDYCAGHLRKIRAEEKAREGA